MVHHERRSTTGSGSITTTTTTTTSISATISRTDSRTSMTRMTSMRAKKRAWCTVFGIFCVLQVLLPHLALAAVSASAAAIDEDDAMRVGRTAHEPKFGERLLPLRKKSASLNAMRAGNGSGSGGGVTSVTTTLTTTASVRSVNSLLSRSNYVVSQAGREPDEESVAVATLDDANDVDNDNDNDDDEVAAYQVETHAVSPSGSSTTSRSSRQGKQLNRREDTNFVDHAQLDDVDEDGGAEEEALQLELHKSSANISKADRLVVMSTEFFVVPTSSSTSTSTTPATPPRHHSKSRGMPAPSSHSPPGPRSVLIVAPKSKTSTATASNASVTPPTIESTQPPFAGLRREPWVVPVLVLAALTMLMMAAFEIFVLFKAWRTSPSRRHLFLGQMLLLGLFACAGLGAVITAQPSLLSCGTIRFGVGVAYALVFAALLVKCVFLISLNGGVYLPAPYQGLLLLFAVLIQVAIGAQWLLTQPPEIYTLSVPVVGSGLLASSASLTASSAARSMGGATDFSASSSSSSSSSHFAALFHAAPSPTYGGGGDLYARITATGTVLIPLCKTQFSELLLSLIYIVFLIVFVAVLAIKSRGIRDNYREATYIGLAIGGAIPIWLGWMLCGLAVAERHKDACIAFGLIATSATVFLVMFMPKGRQLAAMGKEGLYVEDREEQFSSLSRAGSGYSPSFFHFKPIKYGVMGGGGMPNSATNTGNGASMKHCSNGMSGGDRVALVTAAPPSYTRMYHYFPAHLTTHPFCFYPQPPPPIPPPPPPPPPMTQLPSPPTLKQLGNSLSSMTQAHIAQTLRYPGLFIRPDEANLYTTLEPTLSSNPNVYFQRGGAVHPGMMY